MSKINVEIKTIKVTKIHIDISPALSRNFELKAECKAQIKPPKDEAERTALLSMELFVYTPDKDDFKIELATNVIFKFDEIPDDYNKAAEQECIPLAQKRLFNILDEILINMGYKKLGFAEKHLN